MTPVDATLLERKADPQMFETPAWLYAETEEPAPEPEPTPEDEE